MTKPTKRDKTQTRVRQTHPAQPTFFPEPAPADATGPHYDESYYTQVSADGIPLRWLEPRPDLPQDTDLWRRVLREALNTDRKLHGLLHCLRLMGARIVDGEIVPPPLTAPLIGGDFASRRPEIRELVQRVWQEGKGP